jgi:glyoxylase-like metal-dependent hydrolase (beta-lactamase superfamily II)
MKQVADGVWQLRGFPPNGINVYFADGVLFDAATRYAGRRILRQLKDRQVTEHALTHAHSDHQGASHEVCEKLGIPLAIGENDADAIEDPKIIGERQPDHWLTQLYYRRWTGPAHPVARRLREGDQVGSFSVLDAPGHSEGHVVYWRESDGVLIVGDVMCNMDTLTGIPGLQEPKPYFTPDPERNRESIRKLAPLEPKVVLFGHGGPLRDRAKWESFMSTLRPEPTEGPAT